MSDRALVLERGAIAFAGESRRLLDTRLSRALLRGDGTPAKPSGRASEALSN
jgi:hypothetical protein